MWSSGLKIEAWEAWELLYNWKGVQLELRLEIRGQRTQTEEYYTYLDNARNGRAELNSALMSQYVSRIILANKLLWKLLKLAPYEQKDQYKIEKQILIRTLKAQIAEQQQKEKLATEQPSI